MLTELTALSAIDGRYRKTGAKLAEHFSEYGLIRARLAMQAAFLTALTEEKGVGLRMITSAERAELAKIANITPRQAADIKAQENVTNHDVAAALAYLRESLEKTSMRDLAPYVHFGRTSEDCNNVAYALMLRDGIRSALWPAMTEVAGAIKKLARDNAALAMLARTHGQAATPTTLGKEFNVFASRLDRQLVQLKEFRILAKLNGASGNYCADVVAYPHVDWQAFSRSFINSLDDDAGGGPLRLEHNPVTTQIEPHDTYAELFGIIMRFNTILIDFDQDVWRYISDYYLAQKAVAGEIGSSAMPHKVNPIKFENSEGNFQFANAMLEFFSRKLPISRLQRDLSDSTVQRNIGLALGHCLVGYENVLEGLRKVSPNKDRILDDLDSHPEVLSEAYQTILRRAGHADAYRTLKDYTRGSVVTLKDLHDFVASLEVPDEVRAELYALTPRNYIGLAPQLAKR